MKIVFSTFPYALNNVNSQHDFPGSYYCMKFEVGLQDRTFFNKEKVQRYKMKCKVFCKKMLPQENRCPDAGGEKRFLFSTVYLTPTNELVFMVHNTSKYILIMDLAKLKR